MIEYRVTGTVLKLELMPGVFQPTTTTQLLAEQMGDIRGKTVLDLGCGLGPIAILAALKGAKQVFAVDIMQEACRAAERNMELNGVNGQVEVVQGDLFEPLKGLNFDLIVDDVSGMAEKVSRISTWYPDPIPTGGPDGTLPTVRMLKESPLYLKDNGYLLFPVISLARTATIMNTARDIYGDRLQQVTSKMIPFNDELHQHLPLLEKLKNEGLVDYTQKRSRFLWNLAIYRADKTQ